MKRLTTVANMRLFSSQQRSIDIDQMKIPNFNREQRDLQNEYTSDSGAPQQQHHKESSNRNEKGGRERMRSINQAYSQQQGSIVSFGSGSGAADVQDKAQMIINDFDKKIESRYGAQTLKKISAAANQKLSKGGTQFGNDQAKKPVTMQTYNSIDTPENTFEQKRLINRITDMKRLGFQHHKYSSFDMTAQQQTSHASTKDSDYLQATQFYLNRQRISDPLPIHQNEIVAIENDWQDSSIIPKLENGLDLILKNPGIFPVESINQYGQGKLGSFFTRLPQYSQINEECISPYYPPGHDNQLMRMANEHNCKYMMSTSTISSVLSHIYYCLSNFKSPHFNNLSEAYDREPLKFMISQRKPNTVFLTKLDKNKRVYSVDGDSGFIEPSNVVLLKMGKYMEKMLTTPAQFFEDHYVLDPRTNKPRKELKFEAPKQVRGAQQKGAAIGYEEDYFRYMKSGSLLLRSQIDCQGVDHKGRDVVFELKTRATSVLRYEIFNYIDYLDYEIVKYKGKHSSYEREFYDLIRGGFLKYIMQCKIGRMSGAMVAYHNTQKVFGFEYIELEDMEKRVFGCPEFSDVVFKSSLSMVEKIFDYILEDQDQLQSQNGSHERGQSNKIFKIGFYANEYERFLNVLVEVFDDDLFYQERFKNVLPEYMRDPIDYYISHKIQPQVYKYVVGVYPELNGQFVDHSPILFEPGDSLQVRHTIQRYGKIDFNEYMKFLHEAYKCDSINLDNEYAGTWSFVV